MFRLLDITMDKKINYNDKARSSARKGMGCKKRMFHKRLFFISKGLQLIQRIIANGAVPSTLDTSGTNSSLLLIKKNQKKKKKQKRKEPGW